MNAMLKVIWRCCDDPTTTRPMLADSGKVGTRGRFSFEEVQIWPESCILPVLPDVEAKEEKKIFEAKQRGKIVRPRHRQLIIVLRYYHHRNPHRAILRKDVGHRQHKCPNQD